MYLILPSNTTDYSTNKTSSFRVKLPHSLSFMGDWEVALTEIQYPVSWNTVKTTDGLIRISYRHNGMDVPITVNIQPGYYHSIEELQAAITYSIEKEGEKLPHKLFLADYAAFRYHKLEIQDPNGFDEWKKQGYTMVDLYERPERIAMTKEPISGKFLTMLAQNLAMSDKLRNHPPETNLLSDALQFSYSTTIKRVEFHWKGSEFIKAVQFDSSLQFMLGFAKEHKLKRGLNVADYNADITGAENSFFLYCNIVQPQFVGNSLKPLLRTIPVEFGKLGSTAHKEFISPHYIGVLSHEFDTVEIELRNDSGTLVDFQFGKIIVKLHFRRKTLLNL